MPGNPPTLLDKSFLQSLTLDEAYWFFRYFDGLLTPVLIAELIGDLEKDYRDGRDPTKMVSSLARKLCRTPEKLFNVSHAELGSYELLGQPVDMSMRPVVYGSRFKNNKGEIIEVTDNFALLEMLQAWDDGQYSPDEFRRSKVWRDYAKQYDPASVVRAISDVPLPKELEGIDLDVVRDLQVSDLLRKENGKKNLEWAFAVLNIPKEGRQAIKRRWVALGRPSLYDFAPYVAFTLLAIRTHMFASGLELTGSKQKSNDIIDMEYLLYIPFCRFFVSNDQFQLRFFNQLGEEGQVAVNGANLKSSLSEVVQHFDGSPLSRPLNLTKTDLLAPPKELQNYVTTLWDIARPGWR